MSDSRHSPFLVAMRQVKAKGHITRTLQGYTEMVTTTDQEGHQHSHEEKKCRVNVIKKARPFLAAPWALGGCVTRGLRRT